MRELTALAEQVGITGRDVLITGGGGFVGSRIASALASKNRVTVLDDFSNGSRSNLPDGVTVINGDIRDAKTIDRAISKTELIFHEAALVSVGTSVSQPAISHDINATATLDLLERARREDARIVFASSAAIYGNPSSTPVDETAPKRPLSPYGIQKLAADHYLRVYNELYDLPTVSLRYFNIYGKQRNQSQYSGVIQTFLDQECKGEPLTIHGDGAQTRDFVHIDDIVAANFLAAATDKTGEAYNIGSGTAISINELVALIREVTGTENNCVHEPGRDEEIEHSEANIRKAKRQLGYEPTVPLSAGLSSLLSERDRVQ